jgi:hypothetical protein
MIHYIDCWLDAALRQPTWLKPLLEKTGKIMVARASKYRGNVKSKKNPILVGNLEESLPPYVLPYRLESF